MLPGSGAAWARTQNLDDEAWREGQRSTVPGDLFAVGRSLYVCALRGFYPITHSHEPKILKVAPKGSHRVLITLDNRETRELSRSDLVSAKAADLVGRTERTVCNPGAVLALGVRAVCWLNSLGLGSLRGMDAPGCAHPGMPRGGGIAYR